MESNAVKTKPALLAISIAAFTIWLAFHCAPRDAITGKPSAELVNEGASANQAVTIATPDEQALPPGDSTDNTANLSLNSHLQAFLIDDDNAQIVSLRVTGITESKDFVQYSVESSDGDLGIVTASTERFFAFLQTKQGVYEYAGDKPELKLRKSYLTGLDRDYRRPKIESLRHRR